MIFYRTPSGEWHGTQAAAGKGFVQVDVPTDKPNLLVFLNEHCREMVSAESQSDPSGEQLFAAVEDHDAGSRSDQGWDDMSNAELASLLSSAVEQVGMRGDEAFEAIETHQTFTGVGAGFSRGVHILAVIAAGEHQLMRVLRKAKRGWGTRTL